LFLQSQEFFGADSGIHALLMRHFDRRVVQPSVALTFADPDPPYTPSRVYFQEIPGLPIRPTDFGPSIYYRSPASRLSLAAAVPRVADTLLALAADIRRRRIHVLHATEKPRDAFYGYLLSRLTGAKLVVHLHVGFEEWISPLAKWAIRRADGIVGVSRATAATILKSGLPPERVYHVLNALDLQASRWDPSIDGGPTRAGLGITPDAPVVGIVSRLFVWKGHTHLVKALRKVADAVPEVRLAIVGEDDPMAHPERRSYRAELEGLVRELGLERQVIFTGFRSDIPELMAAFDVFAMPSWDEPFGMVFLEAMAMERPVVAWDSGGAPEVIADGETGYVVERGDVDALAETLLRLIRDPDLRRRLGEAGRRRAIERFSPQRMCRDMVEVYRSVLGEAPATANVQSHLRR
jgi:glycosyltransferase involved in cell wall biosynthesis